MADITVGQLAQQTNKEVDVLLKQLKSFGIEKSAESDTLTPAEMKTLLEKINSSKSSVARKKTTTVKLDGKHKINVSVKRKRRVAKKVEEPVKAPEKQPEETQQDIQPVASVKQQEEVTTTEKIVAEAPVVKETVNQPQAVQEQKPVKPASSGFKITSMPEVVATTSNDDDESSSKAKKKPVKKVFSDSKTTNTKFKREEEEKVKS